MIDFDTESRRVLKYSTGVAAVLLSILPALRLLRILITNGANTVATDDITFLSGFLGKVLGGGYNWLHFAQDTFGTTHCNIAPGLADIVMARLTHLNIQYILILGVVASGASLVLLYLALKVHIRPDTGYGEWTLLILLSALIFSVNNISVFEQAHQTIKTGFTELGLSLGIWAIVRFADRWPGVLLASAGGILASFSFANGLILWLIFPCLLLAVGLKRPRRLIVLAAAAGVSAVPYFICLAGSGAAGRPDAVQSIANVRFILCTLSRPFQMGIGNDPLPTTRESLIGMLGIGLFFAVLLILWRRGGSYAVRRAAAPISIAAFGLLTLWQISIFRSLISPWYTPFATDFWIGLAGICHHLWETRRRERLIEPEAAFSISIAVAIMLMWAYSNRTFSDKSFYIKARTPVAAACLRNYRTAPTYCVDEMALWRPGDTKQPAQIGEILEKYHLVVFAPEQVWTLQGDSVLSTVRYNGNEIGWSRDLAPNFTAWQDFRHLNLFVRDPASVSWTVTLPSGTKKAVLYTEVALSGTRPDQEGRFEIFVNDGIPPERELVSVASRTAGKWKPLQIDLSEMRGKTVTLRFTASGLAGTEGWAVFRFPEIKISVTQESENTPISPTNAPENTDLSTNFSPPGDGDLFLDPLDVASWQTVDMVRDLSDSHLWSVEGPSAAIQYLGELKEDPGQFSRFFIKTAGSADEAPAAVDVEITTSEPHPKLFTFEIPLIQDGLVHTYTYPLRTLSLGNEASSLKISPSYFSNSRKQTFRIESVGFMR